MAASILSVSDLDQSPLPAGANEELAGPPHLGPAPSLATRPVATTERVAAVDTVRGFALMGILIMNICDFGMPGWNYMFPLTTVKPVFSGPHWRVNTILWFARWVFAEGKMRALFSMLFGAGVLLLTGRAEARGAGIRTADIFTRRNMWLALFGVLHCYLIWNGDILFFYGISALLFLFPCRNLKPKALLWAGSIVLLVNTLAFSIFYDYTGYHARRDAAAAHAAASAHRPLSDEQKASIAEWDHMQAGWRPSDKKLYKDIADHQKGYFAAQRADWKDSYHNETGLYVGFGDVLGMMLVGMALYRNGFFSGLLRTRTYALIAVATLPATWLIIFAGAWASWRGHFDYLQTNDAMFYTYDLGRIGGALGYAALLVLMVKTGTLRWLLARIGNVGQMALSNYLLTSSSLKLLFVWSPLHWYGYMDYYKLYIVVAIMWIVNLVWSTIWLRYFLYGPVEWLWRSLTYWQRQPMRLRASVPRTESIPEASLA